MGQKLILAIPFKKPPSGGALDVCTYTILNSLLEIPMAVTLRSCEGLTEFRIQRVAKSFETWTPCIRNPLPQRCRQLRERVFPVPSDSIYITL